MQRQTGTLADGRTGGTCTRPRTHTLARSHSPRALAELEQALSVGHGQLLGGVIVAAAQAERHRPPSCLGGAVPPADL